jgi:uncharacterized protein (UPF0297 family)
MSNQMLFGVLLAVIVLLWLQQFIPGTRSARIRTRRLAREQIEKERIRTELEQHNKGG